MKTLHNGFKGVVVKYQGRIQQWDDAKGYGFVEPNGGGTRALLLNNALGALLMATLLFMR